MNKVTKQHRSVLRFPCFQTSMKSPMRINSKMRNLAKITQTHTQKRLMLNVYKYGAQITSAIQNSSFENKHY